LTKPYTIAELGSNIHPFTKERITKALVYASVAGADAVKVQLFRADHFPNEERAAKQLLEFPRELFGWFIDRARFYRLQVGSSVFDTDAIDLCTRLGANFIKLATREQSNLALRSHAQTFKGTIFRSINFETLGGYEPRLPREVTLGCIPRYPTTFTRKLKSAMLSNLSDHYLSSPWGWSSHSILYDDVYLAAKLGAKVIEKHFKLDDTDLEAGWSLDMFEWAEMERMLKNVCRL
jgi:sialic acid synthase SpsE